MSEGHKPAPRIKERVGRGFAFLFGAGITVLAVLTVAGVVVWSDGAGEPVHNIFVRIVIGLIYGLVGLAIAGDAIHRFPEVSPNHGSGTRGDGIDDDDDSGDDSGGGDDGG